MIFNVSAKCVTLLLAVGVVSTTGSNLRQRQTSLFNHGHHNEDAETAPSTSVAKKEQASNLRGAPIDTSDDYAIAAAAAASAAIETSTPAMAVEAASTLSEATSLSAEPSLSLTKTSYMESESITINLSVGSPSHAYYSSSSAPSLHVDSNYPQWSVGLFMRDADPQGGTLSPIVSINLCGALGAACDASNQGDWRKYGDMSLTFGDEALALMHGHWPLQVSDYGTGFDAYVLDGAGAAAIGPLEFYIQDDDSEEVDDMMPASGIKAKDDPMLSSPSSSGASAPVHSATKKSGLVKYGKGTKMATSERAHAQPSKPTHINTAVKANTKIAQSNGLEMSSASASGGIHKTLTSEESEFASMNAEQGPSKDSITSNKNEYESDDEVSINFSIDTAEDLSNYKIGIFMRMAHPQGGALDPVVSLPITSTSVEGVTSGSVTFSSETMDDLLIGSWPINLYEWGTGFDAYVLDENGGEVVGPVKFNIMMDDTY